MIEVLRAGPLTTVQDLGRTGHRREGVGLAGALDPLGLELANRLVGNPPHAAGLEVTAGGLRLRFRSPTWIAVAGVGAVAELDGRTVWPGWREQVRPGAELVVKPPQIGLRSWLAVAGGMDVPLVLGARSTDLRAGFGGLDGRALLTGDVLPLGEGRPFEQRVGIRLPVPQARIRFVAGPEWGLLSSAAQVGLLGDGWKVALESNRMGYRLAGREVACNGLPELLSHGVMPGMIQLPPGGQPIILLADAQTTGGYPRIGVVITADLWKLAYLRPGERLRLVRVGEAEARQADERLEAYLKRVQRCLDDVY